MSIEVFEILDTTGMDEIVRVRKKPRRVSIDGCAEIGKGASGTVYRLDEETVVKVYRGGEAALPAIEEDQKIARKAFVSGIPTAIPFDIVRVGDDYGAVFEMLSARNLNDLVKDAIDAAVKDASNPAVKDAGDPAFRETDGAFREVIGKYVSFIRMLHEKKAEDGQFRSAKEVYLDELESLDTLLPDAVRERLRQLLTDLPEDRHLIHGDIQMKNVVLSGDEMMLIDLEHLCTGNPVFEFAALYATYIAFNEVDPGDTMQFLGIDADNAARIYHETLRCYLEEAEAGGRLSQDDDLRRQEEAGSRLSQEDGRAEPDRGGQLSLQEAELRARILGYLRFMAILHKEGKHIPVEKKERGFRLAAERLTELACKVEALMIL